MAEHPHESVPDVPAETGEATAKERWRVLTKNPRRLIIALVLILVAVGVAVFATATFTSSSANAGNLAAAGTLSVDSGDTAIFTAENLVPSDSREGTASVSNTGSVEGNFSLTAKNLVDTPASPPFSQVLRLVITETTKTISPREIYRGDLGDFTTEQLGTWDAGSTHTYQFTITFPSQGDTLDNRYQGASSTVDFVWNAVSG